METKKMIYDGKGAILGRLGSVVAKDLLKGKYVELINCEEILVSGDKKLFVQKLLAKLKMGRGSSLKGPKYIRQEDRLVKRIIRGMLPWDRPKGRDAYKRFKCHIGSGNLSEEDLKKALEFKHQMPRKYFSIKEVVVRLR